MTQKSSKENKEPRFLRPWLLSARPRVDCNDATPPRNPPRRLRTDSKPWISRFKEGGVAQNGIELEFAAKRPVEDRRHEGSKFSGCFVLQTSQII